VECLSPDERQMVVKQLLQLRKECPKLDMSEGTIKEFLAPPESPEKCIFAKTTRTISADFKTVVEPCQFGGNPDCSKCGCYASMALASIGHYRLAGNLTPGSIFFASVKLGETIQRFRSNGRSTIGKQAPSHALKEPSYQEDEKLRIIS
jgi:hypothetical protein